MSLNTFFLNSYILFIKLHIFRYKRIRSFRNENNSESGKISHGCCNCFSDIFLSISSFRLSLAFVRREDGNGSFPGDSYSIINVRLSGHLLLRSDDMV